MKKMSKDGRTLNIKEHIILRNFWEYYITDDQHDDDVVRALVIGDEIEIGDVSLSEIRPYIISRTKRFGDVMPAPGWRWD